MKKTQKQIKGLKILKDEISDDEKEVVVVKNANKLRKSQEYQEKKKSKGVSTRHLEKRVDFDDYKDCLLKEKIISRGKETSKEEHREKIYTFVSHNMKMYSVEQSKIVLSWKDDKRIPMSHNKHLTYALGHYNTM